MAISRSLPAKFPAFLAGFKLTDGDVMQALMDEMFSAENGITATAGGTKAAARPLTCAKNTVSVCATAADSVLLPAPQIGRTILVANRGAASMQVFGSGSDTINGVATGTGVAQAAGIESAYYCDGISSAGVGTWQQISGS